MATILAEVSRGGEIESLHHGVVAVVNVEGELVAAAGDPDHFAFFRSSAKPFQALPAVISGAADSFGFTPAELALCCASHHAERHHQVEVAGMLAKLGLGPEALRCGAPLPGDDMEAGRVAAGLVPRSPLQCDCSGKHTGMLAACLQYGFPLETYLEPTHPLQRRILEIMASVMRMPGSSIRLGTDGCSLPTFGAPLRAFATAYATLAQPERAPQADGREYASALRRLAAAMVAHPENVAGCGSLVTDLMAYGDGRIVAKSGAEGLLCLALPERGLGVAIRILDGSFRAHAAIAAKVLEELGEMTDTLATALRERHVSEIRNHNGWQVGEIRSVFSLEVQ